jgi:zinc D-Ala-D-Ala carboxypeptidase
MNLTKNFTLEELTKSDNAQRLGIDNSPTEQIKNNLKALCEQILQPARDKLGPLQINSGYRSIALNAATPGSSNTSAHTLGYAADINPKSVTKYKFARFVANNCKFDQIILEFGTKSDPAWVHVSSDPRFRKQIFRKLAGTGYIEISRKDLEEFA